MRKWKWVGPLCLLGSTCSDPLGVLVELDSWPEGAVSLRVVGSLDGTPSTEPLSFPSGTTRFVVYLPETKSGRLSLAMTALDDNDCPRATAETQIEVKHGLRAIAETQASLTPVTPPYCSGP